MIKEFVCKELIKENCKLKEDIDNLKHDKQEQINKVNAFWKKRMRESIRRP